ncbi:hypothetical protein [Legionella waltersii]|uniref:Uncharacterized protein n=1 Tax=Legionella waltersii TaxID=66969 RepID=A0A0W0ZZX4_9GAMM|nr:hypothetical protein [Legionella waltersii]KTD74663.1 hypothetical protein Lwal_2704 [Legionella waltersii]SNV09105.1 Uncharacterised protein [Legionella waltersii]
MANKKEMYIFTLIGLVLGTVLDLLLRNHVTTIFYYSIISLFAVLFVLTYNNMHLLKLVGSSFIASLFLSIPLLPMELELPIRNYLHFFTFMLGFPFFFYVTYCFHYAFHHDNTWRVSYSSLFAAVWNTIPLLIVASIFISLTNLLIVLGAFVFKTVGSNFLWDLYFYNHDFKLISNTVLFFIGLGVGLQNITIIHNMRYLLLRIMYYLFPLLAIISVLYFILYHTHFVTGGPEYINPLVVLIPLTTAGILFFNAYFQDGSLKSDYPDWVKIGLRIYRVVLFFISLMMAYRILQDHSIESNLLLYLIVILLFALNYGVTAIFNENTEKKWICLGNIVIGLFFIIALFLFNIPHLQIEFSVGGGNSTNIILKAPE